MQLHVRNKRMTFQRLEEKIVLLEQIMVKSTNLGIERSGFNSNSVHLLIS